MGAYVIRCAISPLLSDIKYLEKLIHIMLKDDIVGFKGHIKNGGSNAIQQRYVYGVSMLVIPDLGKLNLVVNEKYREAYQHELAIFGGREGRVKLPEAPPATFELPPFEMELTGAFVLGGPDFLRQRGIPESTAAAVAGVTVSQGASQGASQDDDEASVASWDRATLARRSRRAASPWSSSGPGAARAASSRARHPPRLVTR